MKKLFSFFSICFLAITVSAQQPINDPNVEKRTVAGFHGIEVATGVELFLTQGGTEEVAVSAAKAEFRDKIVTKVENGILKIHYETNTGSVNKTKEAKNLRAYVSCKMLDKLHASTGASVILKTVLKANMLDMEASTGARIEGELNATEVKLAQSTGSKVELSGTATKFTVKADTGSKFAGENLQTSTCSAAVDTGAKIAIHAGKELNAKASTGGSIRYKGDAAVKEIKKNTGGSVSKI